MPFSPIILLYSILKSLASDHSIVPEKVNEYTYCYMRCGGLWRCNPATPIVQFSPSHRRAVSLRESLFRVFSNFEVANLTGHNPEISLMDRLA